MHTNAATITDFYSHFSARDGAAMAALYAPSVVFTDPVFPRLEGAQAGAMWRMLTGRAHDLTVDAEAIWADDQRGGARWTARYTFAATGRAVVNNVEARFEFDRGAIVRHDDTFGFWRWSRQALGPVGVALGWSPIVRAKVQNQAARALEVFVKSEAAEKKR